MVYLRLEELHGTTRTHIVDDTKPCMLLEIHTEHPMQGGGVLL